MKIAVYISKAEERGFIVQTFLHLIRMHSEQTFEFITDGPVSNMFHSDTRITSIKSRPRNLVLQKLWWNRQLQTTIKKINADLLISLDINSSFPLSISQILVITEMENVKNKSLKQFRSVIVMNKKAKEILIQRHHFTADRVSIVYPYSENTFAIDNEQKEIVKNRYSGGSEFYFYNGSLKQEDLIHLLKAFSHFKIRQQSGFKLLLMVASDYLFAESLESYKYRNDVKFIHSVNKEEQALIIASAYALILPFDNNNDTMIALSSMNAGVPVIAGKDSSLKEITGEAAIYPETDTTKDLGEQMIRLYTNENFREEMIMKGKQVAREFTLERSADSLWSAIMAALV